MSNRKWYEWLLTITYVVMILVCVYLNVFTAQKEGIANIAVNVVMFLIVGAIVTIAFLFMMRKMAGRHAINK